MDLELDHDYGLFPPDSSTPAELPRPIFSPYPSPEPVLPDPIIVRYGDSDLVKYAREPDHVEQLVVEGQKVTANAIFAAIDAYSSQTLKILLANGASANLRLEASEESSTEPDQESGIADAFAEYDIEDYKNCYPIQRAANLGYWQGGDCQWQRDVMISLLLDHGADLYAITVQKLQLPRRPLFPGEATPDTGEDDDSETGTPIYSERSVIHAIWEDGGAVKQILDHPKVNLDLEHRNIHGRTLLHSICRSRLGADAAYDASIADLHRDSINGGFIGNPYRASKTIPSRFGALEMRGANLLAVDYDGKNVLHHLLEARNLRGKVSPIRATLDYVLKVSAGSLLNQPDKWGRFPLHTALQRWRQESRYYNSTDYEDIIADVEKLLDAGANPLMKDGRGNTPLHYLADDGIAEVLEGSESRRLFRVFLSRGVDVNARNSSGRCALDMVLDDDGSRERYRSWTFSRSQDKGRSREAIDKEVFEMFDEAGVSWNEQDPHGRTLLHVVAKHSTDRAVFRAEYLLKQGVDASVKDNMGKTARDVAKDHNNLKFLSFLKRMGFGRVPNQKP